MKRYLLVLTVAVVPASAQWHHFGRAPITEGWEPTGYFGLGVAAPVNPLAQKLNTGFSLEGGVGVTRPYVGINFDAMFTNFGLTDRALVQAGARRGDQKYWGLTIDPVVHVNPRGPVDFYLTGGAGLYGQNTKLKSTLVTQGNNTFDLTSSDTRYGPGVDGGAGFSFNMSNRSRAKLFVEARFHHMFLTGPDANFIPVNIGVRF
jgi:hypothetical protein